MRVLVTGGGGFIGSAVIRRLIEDGHVPISFSRSHHRDIEKLGVECRRGDVASAADVMRAVQGVEAVIHTAAKAATWGIEEHFFRTNVIGTQNVIDSCLKAGVSRLVFTSSPSVIFDGRDHDGEDESLSYPSRFLAPYPQTKAEAERRVLAADGSQLSTVSLRPHLVWGPGDPHIVPRILEKARKGTIRLVGDPNKLVDMTYIDNVADAHVLALNKLTTSSSISGKSYFVTNHDPRPLESFVDGFLGAAGIRASKKRVSPSLAYNLGAGLEACFRTLRIGREPPITRFIARQLATSHWYRPDRARDELGYEPQVSIEKGMQRLKESFRHQ